MAIQSQEKKKGLIETLKNLFSPYISEKEELIKLLSEDYSKEVTIAKMMDEHSEIIPFDFLRERLKRIAEEERKHAEMLRQKIVELGGSVNLTPKVFEIRTDSIHSERGFRKLIADLEFDKEIYEDYISQINKIENDDVRNLLKRIIDDEIKHKDVLMDIVMRLC